MSIVTNQIQIMQDTVQSSQQTVLFDGVSLTADRNFALFVTLTSLDTTNCYPKQPYV